MRKRWQVRLSSQRTSRWNWNKFYWAAEGNLRPASGKYSFMDWGGER